jgi:hypothetical protein
MVEHLRPIHHHVTDVAGVCAYTMGADGARLECVRVANDPRAVLEEVATASSSSGNTTAIVADTIECGDRKPREEELSGSVPGAARRSPLP